MKLRVAYDNLLKCKNTMLWCILTYWCMIKVWHREVDIFGVDCGLSGKYAKLLDLSELVLVSLYNYVIILLF